MGRVLALFDPNLVSFPMIPVHFFTDVPMNGEGIKDAISIFLGMIIETHNVTFGDPTGVLLFLLTLFVYNSKWFITTAA